MASAARISVERIQNHSDRHAMEVAYDKDGLATPLADGDIVRVFSVVPRYGKTVILRGNIANPGRFAWHPGMRVSELIPDKDSLITRNYWWKRTQLGLPAPEFEPTLGFQNLRQPYDGNVITLKPPVSDEMNAQDGHSSTRISTRLRTGRKTQTSTDRVLGPESQSVLESVPNAESEPGPGPKSICHAPESRSVRAAAEWKFLSGSAAKCQCIARASTCSANDSSPSCSRYRLGLCAL